MELHLRLTELIRDTTTQDLVNLRMREIAVLGVNSAPWEPPLQTCLLAPLAPSVRERVTSAKVTALPALLVPSAPMGPLQQGNAQLVPFVWKEPSLMLNFLATQELRLPLAPQSTLQPVPQRLALQVIGVAKVKLLTIRFAGRLVISAKRGQDKDRPALLESTSPQDQLVSRRLMDPLPRVMAVPKLNALQVTFPRQPLPIQLVLLPQLAGTQLPSERLR